MQVESNSNTKLREYQVEKNREYQDNIKIRVDHREYQDLHLQSLDNTGEYQEPATKPETSVKLVINKPEITYENTKMEGQRKSEQKFTMNKVSKKK